jgi:short-subunit dehydrogenase
MLRERDSTKERVPVDGNKQQIDSLRRVPLFSGCPPEDLADIASELSELHATGGTTLFHEGDPGAELFIIVSGSVRIVAESRRGETIAELGAGDFFGETALITGLPRSAGAVATSDTRLWRMSKDRFDRIIREQPQLSIEMSRVLSRRAQRPVPVGRDLAGRTVLLTGASRGIGVFIARAFARERCNLVLAARSADALRKVESEVQAMGVRALAVQADMGKPSDLQALVVRGISEFGSIDVLVNNAGLLLTLAYHKVFPREIDELLQVNLTGPLFLSWLVLPGMLERGSGHVVNIASLAGKYGPAYNELYAASKAGLIAFTQSMRASCRGSGVSASVICPGFVESGMYQRSRGYGLRAPRVLGSSSPESVADAVVRAVKKDLPEIILNPGPIRLMMALPTIFPGLAEWARRRLGTDDLYRKAAEIRERRRAATGR